MPFLQLRITADPSQNRPVSALRELINAFIKRWIVKQDKTSEYTCGFETHGKIGEDVPAHFHIHTHFEPPDLKDPLRSAREFLKRKAMEIGFKLKGNKQWACTLVGEPKDYARWIRYPLKETPCAQFCSPNFEKELFEMHQFAKEERKRSIELNIIKNEKIKDKQSFKDKLFKFLDNPPDGGDNPKTHCSVWIAILQYYQEQGKAVCYKTISGYTDLYQLYKGYKTPMEAYAEHHGWETKRTPFSAPRSEQKN